MIHNGSKTTRFEDSDGDSTDDAVNKPTQDLYKPYGLTPSPAASTANDRWWLNGNRRRHKLSVNKRNILRRRRK